MAVVFEQGSLRETLAKLHHFTPLSLLLGLLLVWASIRRLYLHPLLLGMALLSLSFMVGGVLTGCLNPVLAELLGVALGLGLALLSLGQTALLSLGLALLSLGQTALLSLGRTYLPPFLLVMLVPLTFLSVGNAGLLPGLLAVAILVTLLRSSGWKGWQRNIISRD